MTRKRRIAPVLKISGRLKSIWNIHYEHIAHVNEDQQEFVPWDYPILEHEKSLSARRFFPDQNTIDKFTSFVAAHGGRKFFQHRDWHQMLDNQVVTTLDGGQLPGDYESDEAHQGSAFHAAAAKAYKMAALVASLGGSK